jgi:hypothetical protein
MITPIKVLLDEDLLHDENAPKIERSTPEEKKAVKWLRENAPVAISVKFSNPFWDIG